MQQTMVYPVIDFEYPALTADAAGAASTSWADVMRQWKLPGQLLETIAVTKKTRGNKSALTATAKPRQKQRQRQRQR